MSFDISIADLTLESGEVPDVNVDDAVIDNGLKNPIYEQQFSGLQTILEIRDSIDKSKVVCREDMQRLAKFADIYPPINKLFQRHPLNSFTLEPSTVNVDVSTESTIKSAFVAVGQALSDVLSFIWEQMKRFWEWLTEQGQRTAQVDGMAGKLAAVSAFIRKVDEIVPGTAVAAEYVKVRDGAYTSELHNLNKKWTAFRTRQLREANTCFSEMEVLMGVIKVKLPPFLDGLAEFLEGLVKAETEVDVKTAIAKLELSDIITGDFVRMVSSFGFDRKSVKMDPRMTAFQGYALYIKNGYRSLQNDRTELHVDASEFRNELNNFTITPWADGVNETIRWARGRTEPLAKQISKFNSAALKPQLSQTYTDTLVPLMKDLTSILAGFKAIEESMGMLTANRNNTDAALAGAALTAAKTVDKFIVQSKAKFTMAEQNILWRARKDLGTAFS